MKKHLGLLGGALIMIVLALVAGCAKQPPTGGETVSPPPAPATPAAAPSEQGTAGGAGMKGGEEFTYTCPMHPEVEQDEPGKCPQCGMFLEAKAEEGTEIEYYCPMDEGQESDQPGKCSKCGMFLAARTKTAAGEESGTGPKETEGGEGT